jgi:LytR cell envelope-related transcriptional attenuator
VNPGVTRLVIVLGLIVGGIVVLSQGFGEETVAAPTASPEPTVSESPSPSPPPDDGEIVGQKDGVLVQVLNGTFSAGLASDFQIFLVEEEGYLQGGEPADGPEKPIIDTVVYFRPDDHAAQNEADAKLLADDYLEGAPVERLPAAYRGEDVTDPAADVIVVLGEDAEV